MQKVRRRGNAVKICIITNLVGGMWLGFKFVELSRLGVRGGPKQSKGNTIIGLADLLTI